MQTVSVQLPDSPGKTILHEQHREQTLSELEAELIKGIESGFGEPISPAYWEKMREKLHQRIAQEREVQQ